MKTKIEMTKMSSRGQVVIPQDIRTELFLKEGTPLLVFGRDDMIILKKIAVPTPQQVFEEVNEWGVKYAKKHGLKEKDVEKIIHKRRSVKY